MTRRATALLITLALLAAACTDDGGDTGADDGSAPADETTSEVSWGACDFDVPAGLDIECGTLEVPADRDEPDGDTVTLAFGVVSTDNDEPADDPIVYLSGGPGQGSLELVPTAFGQVYEPLTENRDLIILDQRGTGFSEPSLACDEYTSLVEESIGTEVPDEEEVEQLVGALDDCRERLTDEGIDLSDYNSAASAADLDELRRALGHEEWNLYGISYGTRLAQTSMRDHPEGIRSVVLDAAYPLSANLYEEAPGNLSRAMDAFFAACASDDGCAERYGDLEETFTSLVEELNAEPVSVTVVDPNTGERLPSELDGDGLVGFLFQSLYATQLVELLPEIIAAADDGEYGTIGVLEGAFLQQLEFMSIGMQLAVQCQEEVAFSDQDALEGAATDDELVAGFFETAPTFGPGIIEVCDGWDSGEPDQAENEAVSSDVPALVLAGELDPITPPRWGRDIAEELPDSSFFTFPFTGHGSLPSRECAIDMTQDFLDEPTGEPDATCLGEIDPPAFTTDDIEVELVPYTSDQHGFESLRPDGWQEAVPGLFQDSPLTGLLQQVVPGATADQLLTQVARQMGAEAAPEPVDRWETDHAAWDIYELDDLGQQISLAMSEHDGQLHVVQLSSTPERHDLYHEQVFGPTVEAFDPQP